ncbi:MAG: GGDEF domain-containing phosphodiesterase [Lachnospiraceae bacterium]|nr:GGDEF domain-containing phosphodiesterase [Ruminococcus sp.]MCM1274579.1 GGDEF domain-containing phosphodiesterase [Lachnospiraceae bacterium]
MSAKIPEKYADRLVSMMQCDEDAVHFFWSPRDGVTVSLASELLPADVKDPLDWLRESGMIDEQSLPVFDVFCAKIESGILTGTETNSAGTDISVKLPGSGDFVMCHLYALFLRGEDNKITDIHFNLRPYSLKEQFDRDVLTYFTSDKNPKLFSKRCANTIKANPDKNIAFIQFDVERFKLINENYGVEVGDELLQFFNDSLALVCTEEQPFCRLTADVFMIVTTFETRDDLVAFIRKVESMLCGYKDMDYRLVFGVAAVDDRTVHTRRHGDNASLARQLIKGNALENIGFYNTDMKSELHKKKSIEDDMHKALLNGEFLMFLQPKHSIKTGKIIGAEALARWQHPTKGMISPGDFIPVFEQNGFIRKLDSFIWEEACKRIRCWINAGIPPVPISVNISREYLQTFDVVDKVTRLINKYDIPISLLELEITESLDGTGVEDVVKKMKDAGFKMLMDDFGAGYSSLNMLKTTQFDVLKIDRSFLSEFMESPRGRKIIEHTISMSQDIGLDIIAEGVETIEQAEFLSECGCDSAQGFYYSKPIPVAEFDKRLVEVNMR